MTPCADSDTEPNDDALSRRHLVQAIAAGATLAGAGASGAQAQTAMPDALSTADYVNDPHRWGSAEIAAMFPGFRHLDMKTSGAVIRVRHGGSGPPLLLLHGNPESHACWHKVASRLAQRYHVVLADLRGYGDSSLPEPGPNHINYSFRAMAQDMVEVMEQLGYRRYFIAGHDRGGRTTYRMCLDHPERIIKAAVMDVLPNYYIWTNTTKTWATASWHWLFMAQPEPFPERLMSAAGAEFFLRNRMLIRGGTGRGFHQSGRLQRICPLLHAEDHHGLVPRLSRVRDLRLRDGHGGQGSQGRRRRCSSCGARAVPIAQPISSKCGGGTPST